MISSKPSITIIGFGAFGKLLACQLAPHAHVSIYDRLDSAISKASGPWVSATLGAKPKIRTRSFDVMSEALAMVANDAPEVFEAVTQRNRHMFALRQRLLLALSA